MSKHRPRDLVAQQAVIGAAPRHHEVDRTFELPKALYGATVGLYLGFLAVMATGLSAPGLIIPMVIFAGIIVAGFGVPTIWTRLRPDTKKARSLDLDDFASRGVMTHTGRLRARDAATQVLVLPVLVLLWGLAVVTIAATI